MASGFRVPNLWRGHINHHREYALSSSLSIYSAFIIVLLQGYNAAFPCHCCFFLIAVDM